jgi:tetratricopeptide (TPR) repeat protein
MGLFEDDENFGEELKLAEFDAYYNDSVYHFLTADEWEALYQHFMYEIGENDFKKVKFVIYEALQQHQYSVFFTLRMAEIQCKANKIDQALPYLELAKSLSPDDFDVYETSAQIYEQFKMYDDAIENFKVAYKKGADQFDILFQMGLCYLNANKKSKALQVFTKLSKAQPQNEFVLDHIAMLVFDNEWYKKGVSIFEAVIDLYPYSETAWHYYGNAWAGLEKYEKALWAQEMVFAINPNNFLGQFGVASTYQEMEDYKMAIVKYEEVLKQFGDDNLVYTNLGYCAEKLELHEKAKEYYRKAISIDLHTPSAWYGIGMTLMAENRTKECVYFFTNAYKYGKNQECHFGLSLATAFIFNQEYDQAEEVYETLIRVFPDEYEVWLDYSALYSEQKKYKAAAETLETALFYLPGAYQINYRLAALFLKLNEMDKASIYLEQALQSNYKDHNLLYLFDPNFKKDKTLQSLIKQYKK